MQSDDLRYSRLGDIIGIIIRMRSKKDGLSLDSWGQPALNCSPRPKGTPSASFPIGRWSRRYYRQCVTPWFPTIALFSPIPKRAENLPRGWELRNEALDYLENDLYAIFKEWEEFYGSIPNVAT